MDQPQGRSHKESLINLSTLPTELLVYIISFLSSLRDRVKLRYVSKWFRCVTEGTPSLWKEFVWPYYDSREECSVKEVFKTCGQHIKVLSFPYSRVPSTLVEMLQYCSNVQHLSLLSTKLDHDQLMKTIRHLGQLKTLELKVDRCTDTYQLLFDTVQIKELAICSDDYLPRELYKQWKDLAFRPSSLKVIVPHICCPMDYLFDTARLTGNPSGATAKCKLYRSYVKQPLSSPLFPICQLQIEESGQVTTPCAKLSDFGIIGLGNDMAVMTDCQYGGRTLSKLRYYSNLNEIISSSCNWSVKFCNLASVTDFDLHCYSLCSGHLEQLAKACPNLERLNLNMCSFCLQSLQGLQAIAGHCHHLQGLNIGSVCVTEVEDHILLWKILSSMKLIYLEITSCVLRLKAATMINLCQKCFTMTEIRCIYCYDCRNSTNKDILKLSCFPSLNYCYVKDIRNRKKLTIVQDMIKSCKELKCFSLYSSLYNYRLSLSSAYNQHLQRLYISSLNTKVPDEFMTSVSAHGGLVHIAMNIQSLTAEGITSLVRNSPKLLMLHLAVSAEAIHHLDAENFNATLKRMFYKRKLFASGIYILCANNKLIRMLEQGTVFFPTWYEVHCNSLIM